MKITSIKTDKIVPGHGDIYALLDKFLPSLKENSILVIASKVIAICEGKVEKIEGTDKDILIEQESQLFLPREENPYSVSLTITQDTLIATAGIDESNGDGFYILWPENPGKSARDIREYLKTRFNLKNVGVLITDSKTTPLRWGVTAISIGLSGFNPLKDYIGTPDIFGRELIFTKMNVADNLSCAAAVVMGEGSEQTPLAIIEDASFIEFTDIDDQEIKISIEEDIFAPLLKGANWRKGKK